MSKRLNPLSVRASVVGIAVDTVLLFVLLRAGFAIGTAGMLSLPVAAVAMVLLRGGAGAANPAGVGPLRIGRFALAVWVTVFFRAGILAWMERIPGSPLILTAAVASLTSGFVIRAAMAIDTDLGDDGGQHAWSWRNPVTALVIYAVALRLIYLGLPELLHEEAYYWNYSRHLALSYLDHPPMVSWVIRLFTALLGHTELGIRVGAFLWWLLGAWFVSRLTRSLFDASTAVCSVLLFAVLPAYFGFGMFMSPDAAMTACWAGALYFAYRALIDEHSTAWLGFGVCLGVGLLSKYTIVLLGPSVFVFMLVDSRARRWFRRTPAYGAAAIALLLFSPVILWNFQHDWISLIFQGPRRIGGSFEFSLPTLLGAAATLLTPVGFAAAAVTVLSGRQLFPGGSPERRERFMRGFRLLVISTLVPFSVFFVFSLFRHTKVNWTGPVWLGVLPFLGRMMASSWKDPAGRWRTWLSPRTWRTTVIVMLLIYGAGLHYLVLGIPGLSYPQNKLDLVAWGWKELGAKIELVVERTEQQTHRQPLVVGMNRDRLSSWLAFYRSQAMAHGTARNTGAAAFDTAGPDLFGHESHMYRLWFPNARMDSDRPMILVGDRPEQLDVHSSRQWMGPVQEITAKKNGSVTWKLFYRVLR